MPIFIYQDEGVSKASCVAVMDMFRTFLPFLSLHLINSQELCLSNWDQKAMALVIPGGRDLPYHEKLKGQGCKKIRKFVEGGGSFLGICAGAYFACKSFSFEKGFPLEMVGERELKFYEGHAEGPILSYGTYDYDSFQGAKAAGISYRSIQEILPLYYHGGCGFKGTDQFSQVEVLAVYEELKEKHPAIISCSVGEGVAILSGVHFEISSSHLNSQDVHLNPIIKRLATGEKNRLKVCEDIIQRLRILAIA